MVTSLGLPVKAARAAWQPLAAAVMPWLGLDLPADPAASLGLRHSLPAWLAEDLLRWRTPEQAEAARPHCDNIIFEGFRA